MTSLSLSGRSLVSLFSGAGGLDYGFVTAGMHTALAVDLDPWARTSYSKHFGREVAATSVEELSPIDAKGCALIVAGPPCQGFSSLGQRDARDPRNSLFTTAAT